MTTGQAHAQTQGSSLADILERILDKGLVIAGDITVSIADIELLTVKIRLIICSVDKAQEIGINWWQRDRALSAAPREPEPPEPESPAEEPPAQQLPGQQAPAKQKRASYYARK